MGVGDEAHDLPKARRNCFEQGKESGILCLPVLPLSHASVSYNGFFSITVPCTVPWRTTMATLVPKTVVTRKRAVTWETLSEDECTFGDLGLNGSMWDEVHWAGATSGHLWQSLHSPEERGGYVQRLPRPGRVAECGGRLQVRTEEVWQDFPCKCLGARPAPSRAYKQQPAHQGDPTPRLAQCLVTQQAEALNRLYVPARRIPASPADSDRSLCCQG